MGRPVSPFAFFQVGRPKVGGRVDDVLQHETCFHFISLFSVVELKIKSIWEFWSRVYWIGWERGRASTIQVGWRTEGWKKILWPCLEQVAININAIDQGQMNNESSHERTPITGQAAARAYTRHHNNGVRRVVAARSSRSITSRWWWSTTPWSVYERKSPLLLFLPVPCPAGRYRPRPALIQCNCSLINN